MARFHEVSRDFPRSPSHVNTVYETKGRSGQTFIVTQRLFYSDFETVINLLE